MRVVFFFAAPNSTVSYMPHFCFGTRLYLHAIILENMPMGLGGSPIFPIVAYSSAKVS